MNHIALIDMDNTVANWDESVRKHLRATASPADINTYGDPSNWLSAYNRDARPDWLEERIEMIMRQDGFWVELKHIPFGVEVVQFLSSLGFAIMVASKSPADKPAAWTEKLLWCRLHLRGHRVTLTEDKSLMMGDVLFEDWPSYIRAWTKNHPDGRVVMPDTPHNQDVIGRNILRVYPEEESAPQLASIEQFVSPILRGEQ